MKKCLLFALLITQVVMAQKTENMEKAYTYLALGDSYTIGEALPLHQSFPYQVVQQLREKGINMSAPEIIAKTGWTTDELATAAEPYHFAAKYNVVTLLIGVNNQYRGRAVEEYTLEFENLLKKAISLADGKKEHVIVLSIPDYSVTPFAEKLDQERIVKELELYNSVNKALSIQYKVHYIDITPGSRAAADDASLIATDKLHPSEKEYKKWADEVVKLMSSLLK